jgi:hypothetical protein
MHIPSSNYMHFKCMEPKPWFQRFQLGSNFIWNQPKIQKPPKEPCRLVAREAHGTHGGVRSHVVGCSHVHLLSHSNGTNTSLRQKKNKGISDEPKSKSPNLAIPFRNA